MLVTALFTTAKRREQLKCAVTDEWIKKMTYSHSGLLFSHKEEGDSGWSYNTQAS